MSGMNAPASTVAIASALLVSNDAVTIKRLRQSLQQLALSLELCAEVPAAMALLNQRKFEAVVVDLQLGSDAAAVLERVRRSPSNRTAVMFAVSDSDAETAGAFKAGSNFVMRRPLSLTSIARTLKIAYGLILRERRRYFRCPVQIPVAICRPGMADVHGQTVNISGSGIAIATSTSLRPGVEVQVHFILPGHELRFVVGATVCWHKESYLGLQFSSISPHLTAVLEEWLLQRLEEGLPESLVHQFQRLEKAPANRGG